MSITITIIAITCIVSITAFSKPKVIDDLIFYPPDISKRNQWYRFISCGFIHADYGHLFFNMFSLYMFGDAIEGYLGQLGLMPKATYLFLYLSALVVSLLPTYFKHKDDYYYRSLGASGAVSAVITAIVFFNPWGKILLFGIVPMSVFLYVALFIGISGYLSRNGKDNINHDAHLWGAVYGLVFMGLLLWAFRPEVFEYFIEQLKEPKLFGR